jgi:hypothetical protein
MGKKEERGTVYQGLRLDGKKGRFTLKVKMQDNSYEEFEFNRREEANDALRRAGLAGCHGKITEN